MANQFRQNMCTLPVKRNRLGILSMVAVPSAQAHGQLQPCIAGEIASHNGHKAGLQAGDEQHFRKEGRLLPRSPCVLSEHAMSCRKTCFAVRVYGACFVRINVGHGKAEDCRKSEPIVRALDWKDHGQDCCCSRMSVYRLVWNRLFYSCDSQAKST